MPTTTARHLPVCLVVQVPLRVESTSSASRSAPHSGCMRASSFGPPGGANPPATVRARVESISSALGPASNADTICASSPGLSVVHILRECLGPRLVHQLCVRILPECRQHPRRNSSRLSGRSPAITFAAAGVVTRHSFQLATRPQTWFMNTLNRDLTAALPRELPCLGTCGWGGEGGPSSK